MNDGAPVPATLHRQLQQIAAARSAGTADLAVETAVERAFGCAQRLAVYGTLAPGGVNHRELAGLGGRWQPGRVHGRRAERAFPVFTWDEGAAAVDVMVLTAPRLADHWPRLDAFEGADYRRILVPVQLAGDGRGALTVANLYAAVVPVPVG